MTRAAGALVAATLVMAPYVGHASPPTTSDTISAPAKALSPEEAALVGNYDGGQTELAARLLLLEDRQFGFWLSYGALDEIARGHWSLQGEHLVLVVDQFQTNDPYNTAQLFGSSTLALENDALTLPRHGRRLQFRRDEE